MQEACVILQGETEHVDKKGRYNYGSHLIDGEISVEKIFMQGSLNVTFEKLFQILGEFDGIQNCVISLQAMENKNSI